MDGMNASGFPCGYSLAKHYPTVTAEEAPVVVAGREAQETADQIADMLDRWPQDWDMCPAVVDQWGAQLADILEEMRAVLPAKRELRNGWLVPVRETRA